jgi:hypothetical protein
MRNMKDVSSNKWNQPLSSFMGVYEILSSTHLPRTYYEVDKSILRQS